MGTLGQAKKSGEDMLFWDSDNIFDLLAESWDATLASVCLWKLHYQEGKTKRSLHCGISGGG